MGVSAWCSVGTRVGSAGTRFTNCLVATEGGKRRSACLGRMPDAVDAPIGPPLLRMSSLRNSSVRTSGEVPSVETVRSTEGRSPDGRAARPVGRRSLPPRPVDLDDGRGAGRAVSPSHLQALEFVLGLIPAALNRDLIA